MCFWIQAVDELAGFEVLGNLRGVCLSSLGLPSPDSLVPFSYPRAAASRERLVA